MGARRKPALLAEGKEEEVRLLRAHTLLPLVALTLAAGPAHGDAGGFKPEVDAFLAMDQEHPAVGEVVEYHVRTVLPEGWELQVPDDLRFAEGFRTRKGEVVLRRQPADGGSQQELVIPLTVVRLGRLKIDERDFVAATADGEEVTLRAGRVSVVTGSLFPTESEPQPTGALEPLPVHQKNWLLVWSVVVLGAVALAVLVTVVLMSRARRRRPEPAAPPRPAHEIARERLQILVRKELVEKGLFEPFYTELSEILREYLGGRWEFDSLDMTTSELVDAMAARKLEHDIFRDVGAALSDFDLVKFAKVVPSATTADEDLGRVAELVEKTFAAPADRAQGVTA